MWKRLVFSWTSEVKDFLFKDDFENKSLAVGYFVPFSILGSYIAICCWLGPWYMKNRKPYNLRYAVVAYDTLLVLLNVYLASVLIPRNFVLDWSHHCPRDTDEAVEKTIREQSLILWHLLLSRYVDLFDTLFFILRKKIKHVSALHVGHHTLIPLTAWIVVNVDRRVTYLLAPMTLNCCVHVVMYSYYALSALGIGRTEKWKKYVTALQLTQFTAASIYIFALLGVGCFSMTPVNTFILFGLAYLFGMFIHFYVKTFTRKWRRQEDTVHKRK